MTHDTMRQLIPSFILADKNGYALARAIERAMQIFTEIVQNGLDTLKNVDKMPEWRLDELAWELGCLYDHNASIETKRHWIRNAVPMYAALGTPQAIYNYLEGYFEQVELEEYWQYAGEPFHFRVTVSGEWNDANEAWLRRAIASAKNVRSVLDNIALGSGTTIIVSGEGGVLARFGTPLTGDDLYAGTYPEESLIGRIADAARIIAAPNVQGYTFPYPQAGTQPHETTAGRIGESRIAATPVAEGYVYSYPSASEEARAGTIPEETTAGKISTSRITAAPAAEGYAFPYPATSEEAQAGTRPEENTIGMTANSNAQTATDGKATAFTYTLCASEELCGDDSL